MVSQSSQGIEDVKASVRAISEYWRATQYERLGPLLPDDVVIAPPGFGPRIRGRNAYVRSHRDYDQAASTLEFSADDSRVDVVGEVAVGVSPFRVLYEAEGVRQHEQGREILVFSRSQGKWRVVWRTDADRAAHRERRLTTRCRRRQPAGSGSPHASTRMPRVVACVRRVCVTGEPRLPKRVE